MDGSRVSPLKNKQSLVIGLDADDTLWHNEIYFRRAGEAFVALLGKYGDAELAARTLSEIEIRNVATYGYGFKSYTLSMMEAASALAGRAALADLVDSILGIGRGMLTGEVLLFEHAHETLTQLAAHYPLMLLTKGDLLEQSSKVRRSGLAGYFRHVEILEDKTPEAYSAVLAKHDISTDRFLMVGNSLRSDILPVLDIGARAVFIPYEHAWSHDNADGTGYTYTEIAHLGLLPKVVAALVLGG